MSCLPQDDSVELATSSDEEDPAHPAADGLVVPTALGQSEIKDSTAAKPTAHRKRQRTPEVTDDPDQATSVRVRHGEHQHAPAPAASQSSRPTPAPAPAAAQIGAQEQSRDTASAAAQALCTAAPASAGDSSVAPARVAVRPSTSQATTANAPAASASSQQGDCIGPDGTFVGRAAAAGLPPNIMRQTRAALGLWEQLHETASTPSTVLAPVNRHALAARTVSVGTDNSAA